MVRVAVSSIASGSGSLRMAVTTAPKVRSRRWAISSNSSLARAAVMSWLTPRAPPQAPSAPGNGTLETLRQAGLPPAPVIHTNSSSVG